MPAPLWKELGVPETSEKTFQHSHRRVLRALLKGSCAVRAKRRLTLSFCGSRAFRRQLLTPDKVLFPGVRNSQTEMCSPALHKDETTGHTLKRTVMASMHIKNCDSSTTRGFLFLMA
jgi:hypothetical protein